MDWMDTESNEWSDEMMEDFIWSQNSYSYDGESPVKRSAETLIRFCDMDAPDKVGRFNEIYSGMYSAK